MHMNIYVHVHMCLCIYVCVCVRTGNEDTSVTHLQNVLYSFQPDIFLLKNNLMNRNHKKPALQQH